MRSRRVFLVVLVVVGVVLSASILAGFQVYKQTVATEHQADIQQTADQVRSELDARLAGHRQTVELGATRPAVAAHGSERQRTALRSFVNATRFSGASVVAANGTMTNIVAGLSDPERRALVGQSFADRAYVRRALDGETYVSEPVPAESGRDIITVSTPIRRGGDVVGTLNAAFHLSDDEFFTPVTESLGSAEGVTVRSASGRAMYVVDPSPDRALIVRNTTLEQTGWTVSVAESRAIVRPTLRRVTVLQFVGVTAVLASIAGFGWWNYRRNLQQVERLLDGFDAFESGDFGTRVDIGGATEWDRIGEGFNDMSSTVERIVAERRERTRQLKVLDRVLRHNLRNELNIVRGRAELVRDREPDDPSEHAAQIIDRCDALLDTAEKERTINNILSKETTAVSVDVAATAADVADAVGDAEPDATVTYDGPESATATAVPQFQTAVRELVENGVVHGDQSPAAVDVRVDSDDDAVRLTVADHGSGIPEMERRVISGDDIDALHHSQGLGLWLVYWAVERSGGDLEFTDNEPRGTAVTVELPAAD